MNPVYPNVNQSIVFSLLLIAAQLVFGVVIAVVFLITGKAELISNPLALILPGFMVYLLFMYLGYKKTKLPLTEVYRFEKFGITLFIPLFFLIAGSSVICSELDNLLRYFLPAPEFLTQIMKDLTSKGIGSVIALVVFAPVTEELIMRGLILNGLLSQYSTKKAVIVSAALFAFIHLNPYQFAGAFIFGILAGYIFIATKSLLPCIICHAFYNGIPLIVRDVFKVGIEGYSQTDGISNHSFQPVWFNALGILIFSIGLFFLIKYFRKQAVVVSDKEVTGRLTMPGSV